MRISDCSSDVCSSDLLDKQGRFVSQRCVVHPIHDGIDKIGIGHNRHYAASAPSSRASIRLERPPACSFHASFWAQASALLMIASEIRSEEHTSELQSLMRISYAVFCLKKKQKNQHKTSRKTTRPRHNTLMYTTTQK